MGSKAKPVLKGQTILATARTVRGEYWLKADKNGIIDNMLGYLMAHYAKMYGVQIHSAVVMSNHYHIMLTDPRGSRIGFFQALNGAIATHLKIRFCREDGSLFKPNNLHQMVLLDQTVVEDKHIYTITNPVCAHIVERYWQYKHLLISHHHWNTSLAFERPQWFNAERWPQQITMHPCPPSYFQGNSDEDNIALFDGFVSRSHNAYDEYRPFPVCGMDSVYDTPRHYSPHADNYIAVDDDIILNDSFVAPTPPPPPEHPTPELRFYRVSGESRGRPDFCTVDADLRSNYQTRITSWDTHYADSKAEFPENRNIAFPPGTCKLAQVGVNIQPLADDDWLNPFFYRNYLIPSSQPDAPDDG